MTVISVYAGLRYNWSKLKMSVGKCTDICPKYLEWMNEWIIMYKSYQQFKCYRRNKPLTWQSSAFPWTLCRSVQTFLGLLKTRVGTRPCFCVWCRNRWRRWKNCFPQSGYPQMWKDFIKINEFAWNLWDFWGFLLFCTDQHRSPNDNIHETYQTR